MTGMSPKTVNLTGAALRVGIKRRTLYNMMNDGRFTVAPIAGTRPRLWRCEDLDEWRNCSDVTS